MSDDQIDADSATDQPSGDLPVFTPEEICHHEAGHWLMGALTGYQTLCGDITFGDDRACVPMGIPEVLKNIYEAAPRISDEILFTAAGAAAEALHILGPMKSYGDLTKPQSRRIFLGAHGDVGQVRELAGKGRFQETAGMAYDFLKRLDNLGLLEETAGFLLSFHPRSVPCGRGNEFMTNLLYRSRMAGRHPDYPVFPL